MDPPASATGSAAAKPTTGKTIYDPIFRASQYALTPMISSSTRPTASTVGSIFARDQPRDDPHDSSPDTSLLDLFTTSSITGAITTISTTTRSTSHSRTSSNNFFQELHDNFPSSTSTASTRQMISSAAAVTASFSISSTTSARSPDFLRRSEGQSASTSNTARYSSRISSINPRSTVASTTIKATTVSMPSSPYASNTYLLTTSGTATTSPTPPSGSHAALRIPGPLGPTSETGLSRSQYLDAAKAAQITTSGPVSGEQVVAHLRHHFMNTVLLDVQSNEIASIASIVESTAAGMGSSSGSTKVHRKIHGAVLKRDFFKHRYVIDYLAPTTGRRPTLHYVIKGIPMVLVVHVVGVVGFHRRGQQQRQSGR
ncbi:hypothetical protein BC828DRAFT_145204 [Blastocladiella britannica]|nr:hypothetical protein BC828DRAFT_145204 [Blastocladiella britannica]